MTNVMMEVVGGVLQVALVGLIGLLFAWIRSRIKSERLGNAMDSLESAATLTAAELQQTVVDGLKAANEDGKLTPSEIAALGRTSLKLVAARMGEPTQAALRAAGLDVEDMIRARIEAAVLGLKAA